MKRVGALFIFFSFLLISSCKTQGVSSFSFSISNEGSASSSISLSTSSSSTIESESISSSSDKYRRGFLEEESSLILDSLKGQSLPFLVSTSYTITKSNDPDTGLDFISIDFQSDYYASLEGSYKEALIDMDFIPFNEELTYEYPRYLCSKVIDKEVYCYVQYLGSEDGSSISIQSYLRDNSDAVSLVFPNAAIKEDLGYEIPSFASEYYVISYGLTSDYLHNSITVKCVNPSTTDEAYLSILIEEGYKAELSNDILFASKDSIRLMCYGDSSSYQIVTYAID